MENALVIINENHSLLQEQETLLNKEFWEGWELFYVPEKGWTYEEILEVANTLVKITHSVVFI